MSEDGFRERKVRPKGWMKQAINDGVIADPGALQRPTASEIAAALHALNSGFGDQKAAKSLLADVPSHRLEDTDGAFALVYTGGDAPGVFAAPAARVDGKKEP